MMPDITKIMAWENGEMDEEDEAAFFQQLVDTGLAFSLQGMYGRRAMALIKAGTVRAPRDWYSGSDSLPLNDGSK